MEYVNDNKYGLGLSKQSPYIYPIWIVLEFDDNTPLNFKKTNLTIDYNSDNRSINYPGLKFN